MTCKPERKTSDGETGADDILENPAFRLVLRETALTLLEMHEIDPRVVRYVSSIQKWLITQAITGLHFERKLDAAAPPLTASALIAFFDNQNLTSRNTIVAHLAEMRRYGLVVDLGGSDRRSRPLRLSDYGEEMIGRWSTSHLSALDRLDGGVRASAVIRNPQLLARVQALTVRSLVFDPRWSQPPLEVDIFVRTESGSNILHELISRIPLKSSHDGFVSLGNFRASAVSKRHTLSRGHLQRVFNRAKDLGLLAWSQSENRGDLRVSERLIRSYEAWQAIKFRAIDDAYANAVLSE